MTFKFGILAAAAALTLAVPAIASAQPYYGRDYGRPVYAPAPGYGYRQVERNRAWEWRRAEEARRFEWQRYHGGGYRYGGYYGR
jgi:hypothetical protein